MEDTSLPSALRAETRSITKLPASLYSYDELEPELPESKHKFAYNAFGLSPTKKNRMRSLTAQTKAKTKKLLNVGSVAYSRSEPELEDEGALLSIRDDPAFNPSKIANQTIPTPGGRTDKTIDFLQSIGTAVIHPKRTVITQVKKTTAGNISTLRRPHISQQADLEFLEAHENLSKAESTSSSRQATSGEEDEGWEDPATAEHRDKVEKLEGHRESLRVAWATDHIERVRVVPKRHFMFPEPDAFIERDEAGTQIRYKWEKWLGYVCERTSHCKILLLITISFRF